jgi:hypothetical protein
LNGTIDIPIALLGDGHQQILLEPQDPSISGFFPVTPATFDVIDMSYQVITDSFGLDTYVLLDPSDGTSVVVNPGSGNHIESLDVLQPQGDTTTFQLDFGDHVVAGTSADFNSNHINQNPIAHLIFGSNGFVEFASQENGNPIPIDETNLQQAIDYLAQNCKQDGSTVEFNANINGVNSSYIFHQSADGYHLVNVSDTSSTVQGIDTQVFDQSKIHIVDHP